jgi:hypothetical protein
VGRRWLAGGAGLCFATVLLAAALPPAWKHWRFSAVISGAEVKQAALISLVIPAAVTARSERGWSDLRVIDHLGNEVPFVLHARTGRRTREPRPARLLEVSFQPGESTQGIVDTGGAGQIHNHVEIETTESDFFTYAEVSISDDRRSWRILRESAPIYRFRRDGLEGNQAISYSPSPSRYLRVRILDGTKRFAFDGARIWREVSEEAELAPLRAALRPESGAAAQHTVWRGDLDADHLPVSELRYEVSAAEFHRPVRIRTSHDGNAWHTLCEGDLYRFRRDGRDYERLRIQFPETEARYWRVDLFNRNDPPLAGLRLDLWGTPRRVVFHAEAGKTYRLLFGNRKARAATYEMTKLTERAALDAAPEAALGFEEVNSGWEDPDPPPWSERHKYVLWGAVLIAVAVLGALAVSSLQ